MRLLLLALSIIFSSVVYSAPPTPFSVSGTIFEDYNFGGSSRNFNSTLGMSGLSSTWVQLTNSKGTRDEETDLNGNFTFSNVARGSYTLSTIGGHLYSARGDCDDCLPVQVYPAITTGFSRHIVVSNSNIYNANIGINYSTVLNNNDSGAGSLRQFLINSRYLDGNSSKIEKEDLKQFDLPSGYDNAIFTLGSDKTIVLQSPLDMLYTEETSIDARDINLTLKNHRVAQNTDYGLKIHFSEENFIQGLIFDGFDDSVYINDSSEISLDWNTFKNTRDSGITIWGDSDENIITNNVFENNVNAEDVEYQAAALFMNNSNDNKITNNIFINVGDDHRSDGGYTFHVSAIRVYYGNGNLICRQSGLNRHF
ncbi:MAG: right-handed parallel beta-helix repeat-containing protein [Aliivibrio sp.]|uniref:right-handed parallel beta-helix repeat-containing protein n=1 Tax=Aliivibrio sp. TaxID=1872443 RepID=UPI001A5C79EB|nr:right-handed parallel beta-helix repeat-containing protein [Aliivibrio sp.]